MTGNVEFDGHLSRVNYKIPLLETRTKVSLRKAGSWSDTKGIEKSEPPRNVTADIVQKSKRTRIVTTIEVAPFMTYNAENDTFQGFCYDLLEEIAKDIGFEFKFKLVGDNSYGKEDNKHHWNGMVGELLRGEADIAVAPLTITSGRERVVDFSTPFMEFGLSVLYQKPERDNLGAFLFMDPLSKHVWICIGFAYLGVSVVLFLVSRFSMDEWRSHAQHIRWMSLQRREESERSISENEADPKEDHRISIKPKNEFNIFNSFWFAMSSFVQQGGDILPKSLPGRIAKK
ncbi:Glutamate receptor 3 [Cichlidogyrus casuarinus]|uniref:Glutamate receptor 3 n=1 Tax=Cichlidogyrus casuarinus TaxID=1844966 RepID=A0ABD2PL68_9PLAT